MKIVQSYWSKPSTKNASLHPNDRNLGGWLDKKYNYMSWMLSCLQLNKFYDHIELVTDQPGYELLIEKLKLPYTSVKVELDRLDNYHTDLWALGKIYAYSIQNEPFIHIDGDVFIWDKISEEFSNTDLLVQNMEVNEPGYADAHDFVFAYFEYIPKVIPEEKYKIISVNAGVIGGRNISFFQDYTALALEFVDRNLTKMKGLNKGAFNMFYEQYLFYCLAEKRDLPISYLIKDQRQLLDKHVNFTGAPLNTQYIHTIGTFKKRLETGNLLEYTLKSTYPDQYYYLMHLLTNHIV